MNELHTKTPHERVTAFNDRIKKAADRLKTTDDKDAKKMLQSKIKLAKLGLQNYKQQQALKDKAERERKAEKAKNEEVTQLTGNQKEMVDGIIDMLLQVDDLDNRMEMAKQQIQNFKDENIVFNYAWFLSAAGLDNKDEPVGINTYAPTSTHISPVSINSNMKTTEMKESQQKLVYNINGDAVETFLKKYPKVKQVMVAIASKNKDLMKGYKAFLKFKDSKEDYLGGTPEGSSSPTFGNKVFYKYDFGMLKYHWPEVYQYVHSKQNESVNEVKYPTDLKVGTVIMGQGFTMLKGIEGGKYYKVVAMDDISATLVPSDKNGNQKGSSKVRHKLDSIEGGIKTAKRGDENGIVVIKEESIDEVKVVKTGEKTISKKVFDKIKQTFPNAKKLDKKHVPQIGYVFYVKDAAGKILGKSFIDGGEAVIYIDEAANPQMLKDLDKVKNDLLKKAAELVAKKKKLYSDVDIESPMSAEEKKLDKEIADIFSQINQLVLQKRSLKEDAPMYKDWDEFVNPHYIIVHLNNGKKLKIDRSRVNGGNAVYHAILKAFNDNNYKITNKLVSAMVDKLGESVNEGKYYIGYNKGRGQGKGVFKDTYSTYKEAQKEVEKIQKMMSGSYNMTAYYVADSKGEMVRENWDSEMEPVGKVNEISQYDSIIIEPGKGRAYYKKVASDLKSKGLNAATSAGKDNIILVGKGKAKNAVSLLKKDGIKVDRFTGDGKDWVQGL